jgi:hypothetical protein
MICGYQLNYVKFLFENFLVVLQNAGAELIFVVKKGNTLDPEYLKRRLNDYKDSCRVVKSINAVRLFHKLEKSFRKSCPYNVLILVAMIQSAEKFGKVYSTTSAEVKSSVLQIDIAEKLQVDFMLGLDTYLFFTKANKGNVRIWSDEGFNLRKMDVRELDRDKIIAHFGLSCEQMPLFAVLAGDLQSEHCNVRKMANFFGIDKFNNIANFVKNLKFPLTDEKLQSIAHSIFGAKCDDNITADFKKSLAQFELKPSIKCEIDAEILDTITNDFMNFGEEILTNNMPILITPVYLDLSCNDMMNLNDLVVPWIQKTAGILFKSMAKNDSELEILLLEKDTDKNFTKKKFDVIYPAFEVPSLKSLLNGEMSTIDKMKILSWLLELNINFSDLIILDEKDLVDALILIYLIKKKSLSLLDARCLLKTIYESRQVEALEYSTEYPEKINGRALRCTYLYGKMFMILHSCLACLGMKYLTPEIKVY